MGLCGKCKFYTKRGTSSFDAIKNSIFGLNGCNDIGYCLCSTDYYGNYKKVKGLDSCHCGNYIPKNQWN